MALRRLLGFGASTASAAAAPVFAAPAGAPLLRGAHAGALLHDGHRQHPHDATTVGGLHIVWPGAGTGYFWQAGVMSHLNQHFRMSAVPSVGSSAGGLVAILGACDVPPREAVRAAFRLAREAGVYERRLGLLGIWRGLVQRWLHELLPADAPARCANIGIVVTELPSLRPVRLSGWRGRDDLIGAALASAHIPLLLDGSFAVRCRDRLVMDGSFHYSILDRPESLLPPGGGTSLVFDPRHDPALSTALPGGGGPGACLRSLDDAAAGRLVGLGAAYADRLLRSGLLHRCGLQAHAR
ncbi:hypothetical protein HYH02_005511 [Chlamydomonas schloesseri]|uniref:Patatin n=1 Tax=Chlamydomonas schloesseri TaxID=2026947 RepID=A0A835WL26_9CHLO|nr:hypothetical protein HYH02_005511 [Chlamydomonas schloesseri]|eukprot:KAG2449357.1 hypothetical protein HYH02_005511 [Chlamydomonas schloesseri]